MERNALIFTLRCDPSAVQLCDFLGNGKPQACPPGLCSPRLVEAVEMLEEQFQIVYGDGRSAVEQGNLEDASSILEHG